MPSLRSSHIRKPFDRLRVNGSGRWCGTSGNLERSGLGAAPEGLIGVAGDRVTELGALDLAKFVHTASRRGGDGGSIEEGEDLVPDAECHERVHSACPGDH